MSRFSQNQDFDENPGSAIATQSRHTPVLLNEVLQILDPQPGQKFIDGTINGGGHGLAILEKIQPGGKLLGIEWDQTLIENLKLKIENLAGITLVNDSYANLQTIAETNDFMGANGILLDLGFSSWHLEQSGKGFTFQKDEILDMRYGPDGETAADVLNKYPKEEIKRILREYGEESFSRQITEAIIAARRQSPIIRTFQLAEVVKSAVPAWYRAGVRRNAATKTFQALRLAVNHELENLETGLLQALAVLGPGGRLAVITFHSLEDRIVKTRFRGLDRTAFQLLTKHPIRPEYEETKQNPRARSAKLRVIQKLNPTNS